jgi:hypothetical protein
MKKLVGFSALGLVAVTGGTMVVANAAAASAVPPKTATGTLMRARHGQLLHRGSVVPAADLGVRVFANSTRGFALATTGAGETYPATTINAGGTWRVNGPVFHIPAADAPQVVTQVGMTNGRTYFAWGGPFGGNVVNVTSDGGKRWYQTFLGGAVLSVVSDGPHKLIAVAEVTTGAVGSPVAATWLYVSRDGGRHWRYTTGVNGS